MYSSEAHCQVVLLRGPRLGWGWGTWPRVYALNHSAHLFHHPGDPFGAMEATWLGGRSSECSLEERWKCVVEACFSAFRQPLASIHLSPSPAPLPWFKLPRVSPEEPFICSPRLNCSSPLIHCHIVSGIWFQHVSSLKTFTSFPWLLESSPESVMGATWPCLVCPCPHFQEDHPHPHSLGSSPSGPFCALDTSRAFLVHVLLVCTCPCLQQSPVFYLVHPLSIFLKAQFKCHLLPSPFFSPTPSGQVQDSMSESRNFSALFSLDTCDIYLCDYLFITQPPEQGLDTQQEEINSCPTAKL